MPPQAPFAIAKLRGGCRKSVAVPKLFRVVFLLVASCSAIQDTWRVTSEPKHTAMFRVLLLAPFDTPPCFVGFLTGLSRHPAFSWCRQTAPAGFGWSGRQMVSFAKARSKAIHANP